MSRSGSSSHFVSSPAIASPTPGSQTKKPPLIHAPSPRGFSAKRRTASPSTSSEPKRPGGWTAVTVAWRPVAR